MRFAAIKNRDSLDIGGGLIGEWWQSEGVGSLFWPTRFMKLRKIGQKRLPAPCL